MKAMQFTVFGDSGVIQLNQVDQPQPKENEVLIKIAATTVNPIDMKVRSGFMQKIMPVNLPYIPGSDVSGTVAAVGSGVSRLKVGDKVFASTFGGTYAEYVALKEDQTALIPNNIGFDEAASLAVPLATSYSFLIEGGGLKPGQRVLIHGASGGVGSIMVQMAKALGAYVIGTASGDGLALAKSLGADEVIDYKTQDFTKLVKDVDLVIDLVGGETQTKSFEVVKEGGRLLSAVMPPSEELAQQHHITAKFISSTPSHKKLGFGAKLVEEGKIKTQVAKIVKLEDAAQAQDLVSAGGVNGKVVLEIN
ncbi:NADP-dependent oxidoreductase [Mucilaginibacter sp. BT774]|uniref:NADP-dependent oxidoreductase n=1 Tax=Mucilaginibacter sp. BT774 TaxID=3062276 RepID=UPI002675300D|nr:NADP-dependent oxidoreductase [Mucilaginibacter sp. BT774]MDO3627934.1 NADP-dependent oxidoreductase [Mucilaginibacter sp. BT774]